ncbi:vacuolar membrane protein [Colletotrichum truncatum]|uniref:Vacuolar membrane protein n=1 Tax=Colletotrichum truncatum TaxID=5467 RepID=A0ACC3Z8P6_COLTU
MSIKPLSEDVIRRIRSSAIITSLNGVVCGLIKNSFDAGATKINITIDYSRGSCTVEDDGLGIPPSEFRETGGLGKLYHTSRHGSENEIHGRNGNFIASLAALSLLSVTSHHHLHNSQNSLTIHNSKVLARNIPALPEQRLFTFTHGTRVIVRDLFGSMAVRVKQRVAASEKAAVDKEWSRLMYDVTAHLVSWPSPVALFVRDTVRKNETRFRPNVAPKTMGQTDLSCLSSVILAQSGLVDVSNHVSWIPVGATRGNLTIDGCISLDPVATRRAQFISLGIHPLANEHGSNVLYSEVNRVFVRSGFAVDEDVRFSRELDSMAFGLRDSTKRYAKPKRGLDRWPMFYFRISTSSTSWPTTPTSSFEDLLVDRNGTLSEIIDLLKLVCYEFLKKHHFRPHQVTTSLKDHGKGMKDNTRAESTIKNGRSKTNSLTSSRSSSATPSSRPESPFDLWQRVKANQVSGGAKSSVLTHRGKCSAITENSPEYSTQPSLRLLDDAGNVLRRPFDDLATPPPPDISSNGRELVQPAITSDKFDKKNSPNPDAPESQQSRKRTLSSTGLLDSDHASTSVESGVASAFQRFKENNVQPAKEPSDWLKGVLENWENPGFEPVQPLIPQVQEAYFGSHDREVNTGLKVDSTGCSHGTDAFNTRLSGRISKAALANAEVISQVDQKFILVKLGRDKGSEADRPGIQNNSVLVLVDQHAADERCRLESHMQDYFEKAEGVNKVVARTQLLEKPLSFEFSGKECTLLRRHSHHFRHWGIFYKMEEAKLDNWYHKSKQSPRIEVVSLPPSILERCRTEPKLLVEILRNEIWKREEEDGPVNREFTMTSDTSERRVDWVSNFHGCPQGVLDLLNSRSCRSAIMFNDVLSNDECKGLVQKLSRCAFPFQCAHGRPSMVPLVDIQSLNVNQDVEQRSFGRHLMASGLLK